MAMKFHEGYDQANPRGEFHRYGILKTVKKRKSHFPWTTYKKFYIWKAVNPGSVGWSFVKHKHAGGRIVNHVHCDWVYLGMDY